MMFASPDVAIKPGLKHWLLVRSIHYRFLLHATTQQIRNPLGI